MDTYEYMLVNLDLETSTFLMLLYENGAQGWEAVGEVRTQVKAPEPGGRVVYARNLLMKRRQPAKATPVDKPT